MLSYIERKELREIRNKLFKMCHVVGCEKFRKCPQMCCRKGSDPMLDLETAIAWKAGKEISDIIGYPTCNNGEEEYGINILEDIVGMHQGKYRRLYNLLKRASQIVY